MNLKFVSNRALAELRLRIDTNRADYVAGRAAAILDSLDTATAVLESRIMADAPPKLEMPGESGLRDAENVRRVFQWLHHLTPVQASDPRLWAYLTHGAYADYTAARWPRVLHRFAAEAWRRAEAGELADEELYPCDAQWSGLYDRMHTHESDEMERRLALAADYGESLNA